MGVLRALPRPPRRQFTLPVNPPRIEALSILRRLWVFLHFSGEN